MFQCSATRNSSIKPPTLNSFLNQPLTRLQVSEKKHLLEPIAWVMQQRIAEADADDCSRLGWLWIHLDEPEKAVVLS